MKFPLTVCKCSVLQANPILSVYSNASFKYLLNNSEHFRADAI